MTVEHRSSQSIAVLQRTASKSLQGCLFVMTAKTDGMGVELKYLYIYIICL